MKQTQQNQSPKSLMDQLFEDPLLFWPFLFIGIVVAVYFLKPEWFFAPWLIYSQINAYLYIPFANGESLARLNEFLEWSGNVDPRSITGVQYEYVNDLVGSPLRFFYPVVILLAGYFAWKRVKKYKFKPIGLEELIARESSVWPALKYWVKHNPLKEDHTKGNFRYRVKPWDWAEDNNVLVGHKEVVTHDESGQELIYSRGIDKGKVQAAMTHHLGRRIYNRKDILSESLAYKCVLVMALNRLCDKKTNNDFFHRLLRRLGGIQGEASLDDAINSFFAMPDKKIKKERSSFDKTINSLLISHLSNEKVAFFLKGKHAFTNTLLIRAIVEARVYGIMPSTWFPYLRGEDPLLNLIVNDVGRKKFSVECIGAFSHYEAERIADKMLDEPWLESVDLESPLRDSGVLKDTK